MTPTTASHTDGSLSGTQGFASAEDYVLFGLLAGHGLMKAEHFDILARLQKLEPEGTTLFEMLARSSDLPLKSRKDVQELLNILRTPELARLLPSELPPIETLVETLQTTRLDLKPITPVATVFDASSAETVTGDHGSSSSDPESGSISDSLSASVSRSLTAEELHRLERSRHKGGMIGREVAGHVILDRIGEGGQGGVYLAKQLSLNRYVAMKKLEIPRHADARQFVAAFRREAQILAGVNHGRIVKVYEIFEMDGMTFFTMEHLQGRTLRDMVVKASGPLPTDVVANLACQACSALEKTSAAGLVHRDIKPANMMVDENGDLKIVDFGLASAESEFQEDGKNSFSGTPAFASPEQFDLKALTPLSDMYSLGATFYFALTGRLPFDHKRMTDLMTAHLGTEPEPPSTHNNLLPAAVDRLILRMMAKKPEDRFRSFTECFAEWEKVLLRHSGARTGTRQLLGESLVRFARSEKDKIRNVSIMLGAGWLLVMLGAVMGEASMRSLRLAWFLDACGDYGTWLLGFSLLCIAYVALARRRYLPVVWSLRGWLYTHIATAIPAVIMLLIHSGNFLFAPESIPPAPPPILSRLMGLVLFATAVSGTVGLLIFRALQRKIILQQMELQGASATPREQMAATLGARALSGWRLVHYPLAILFVLLSILHIVQSLRFGVE
jgi:hypothetical protein